MTLSILETEPKADAAPEMTLGTDKRAELRASILKALSGSYVLMTKTQALHWNVSGPLFKSVHDLTEEQYNDLFAAIDDLAERIRALGLPAPISYEAMQAESPIKPFKDRAQSVGDMLKALTKDHETLSETLIGAIKIADEIGDPASEDLFTERLRRHQTHAWMLRAMADGA